MSALRINVPGQPVRLVDQGPACGRVSHTRGPVSPIGGDLVVGKSDYARQRELQAQSDARRKAKP